MSQKYEEQNMMENLHLCAFVKIYEMRMEPLPFNSMRKDVITNIKNIKNIKNTRKIDKYIIFRNTI